MPIRIESDCATTERGAKVKAASAAIVGRCRRTDRTSLFLVFMGASQPVEWA